jgi:hypothetical protein
VLRVRLTAHEQQLGLQFWSKLLPHPCVPGKGSRMKFARVVFRIAGLWGLLVLFPLYFLLDEIGVRYTPPLTHPDFYFGFVGVALVWQIAFLIIATDPIRFRPMMVAAILEKLVWVATLGTLYLQGRLLPAQAAVGVPDLVLGVLFAAAFLETAGSRRLERGPVGRVERGAL